MAQSLSPPQEPADTSLSQKHKSPPSTRRLIPLVLLVTGGVIGSWYLISSHQVTNTLRVSGRIEGYETDIGAKVPGRIQFVAVREGDPVHKNQVIVRLDDAQQRAQFKGASARLDSSQKQEEQARLDINVLESQILENQYSLKQAQGDAKGRIFQAQSALASSQAQLNQARAEVAQAKSELKLAKINRDRYAQLVAEGAVTKQLFDQAQTNYETDLATLNSRIAAVDSARKLVDSAQGQLTQAESTGLNPPIHSAQIAALRSQLVQAQWKLRAAHADVANAKASKQETRANVTDLHIISPINGVVVSRDVEPGAVVSAGKTLLTVIDPHLVYMRAFIPEGNIGDIFVGQSAQVFLDSAPQKPLNAKVAAIDTEASFTPENIYFQQDRVKQVFGVKLTIDNPQELAKPGMPADATIQLQAK